MREVNNLRSMVPERLFPPYRFCNRSEILAGLGVSAQRAKHNEAD